MAKAPASEGRFQMLCPGLPGDWTARHQAQLGDDERVRHVVDDRFRVSLSEFLPEEGRARGVQIDIEPEMLSLRYPMEINLQGDSR